MPLHEPSTQMTDNETHLLTLDGRSLHKGATNRWRVKVSISDTGGCVVRGGRDRGFYRGSLHKEAPNIWRRSHA